MVKSVGAPGTPRVAEEDGRAEEPNMDDQMFSDQEEELFAAISQGPAVFG